MSYKNDGGGAGRRRRSSTSRDGGALTQPPPLLGKSVLLDICEISPWKKWTRYRVVPVKFLLHILLVILTTWSIVEDSVRWVPYRFASEENFCYFFAPDKCVSNLCGSISLSYGIDNPTNCYTYAIGETIAAVEKIVTNYYGIHNKTVANYYLPQQADGSVKKIVMRAQSQNRASDLVDRHSATYILTPDDLGPLDTRHHDWSSINTFFALLTSMQLDLELDDTFASDTHELCYMWSVQVVFNVRNKAELAVSQKARVLGFCTDRLTKREIRVDPMRFWLNVAIVTLGAFLCILILKEWYESYRLLMYAHQVVTDMSSSAGGGEDEPPPAGSMAPTFQRRLSSGVALLFWEEVSVAVKMRFFNIWLLETLLASVLSGTGAAYNLMYYQGPMTSSMHTLLAGLGAALFWINLVNYLHHSDRLYAIVLVIRQSVPRVGKLLVQVVPIFVGYAFLGVMMFGYYYASFGTFAYASASLFSIWNGDMLLDTMEDLNVYFSWFGFVYVLAFVVTFIYVILNIVLCIVQQTLVHVHTVEAKRRHTIHRLVKKNRKHNSTTTTATTTAQQPPPGGASQIPPTFRPRFLSAQSSTSQADSDNQEPALTSTLSGIFLQVLDVANEDDVEEDFFDSSIGTPRHGHHSSSHHHHHEHSSSGQAVEQATAEAMHTD